MTNRRPSLPAVLAVAVAAAAMALVAACGSSSSGTPTPIPSPSAPATASLIPSAPASPTTSAEAGVTPAPSPVASDAVAGTPMPSFTRVEDLEAMLPKKVGDSVLGPRSLTGTDVLATGNEPSIAALQAILDATGTTAPDYEFAWSPINSGSGTDAAIGVFRVKGADPAKVRDILIAQGQAGGSGVGPAEDGTIGGKKVKILRVTDPGGTVWSWYYWPKDAVLFYVQTVDPAVAEEVLALL